MKRLVQISLATIGVVSASSAAYAADLYTPAPVAPAPAAIIASPAFDWTGFYVGATGGYAWGTADTTFTGVDDIDVDGALIGATAGYNYQINGFVLGVEGDISYSFADGSEDDVDFDLDYLGTVRARAGYAFDRVLPYVTGGLAVAGGQTEIPGEDSQHETHVGYTVGGGLEYAFSDAISMKGEYLYTDVGGGDYYGEDVDTDFHTVRIGLNYRF